MKLLPTSSRKEKFGQLVESVGHCKLCSRLCSRRKVLGGNNGNIYSNILFVAEAPGRLGADRTLIPMYGDRSGRNFQKLIETVGWSREDIFITNAVLCNPRNGNGTNRTPTREEIQNCSIYLNAIIEIIEPDYVITLGQKALEGLRYISRHNINLKGHVREFVPWHDRLLIPLYHTSPRAMIHRNYFNQLSDFYYIKQSVKKKKLRRDQTTIQALSTQFSLFDKFSPSKMHEVLLYVVDKLNKVSKFKLAKLLYLIDLESIKATNRLLTQSFYIRNYEGPLQTDFERRLRELEGNEVVTRYKNRLPIILSTGKTRFQPRLKKAELNVVDCVLSKYASYTNSRLKTVTYLTQPMKRILRSEKDGVPMYGKPVFDASDFEK